MVQLYLKEYLDSLTGRRVCIGCREGILRNNFKHIISDIKFLSRKSIETTLFHNLPNRFANQKLVRELEQKLPSTSIIRIAPDVDFYQEVLNHPHTTFKLIFLERHFLQDLKGYKINTLTTSRLRHSLEEVGDVIGNVNFVDAMGRICGKIEDGSCERIHILPAGKNSIRNELFTVEGSGTMVADNFLETFRQVKTDGDVKIVSKILSQYKRAGFLKPRSKDYVDLHRHNFFVTEIDSIVVGCVEKKEVDQETVELGALAISTRFRNQRIGVFTVKSFLESMSAEGYTHFISLTKNPRLAALFAQLDFAQHSPDRYANRQALSPDVPMFYKKL